MTDYEKAMETMWKPLLDAVRARDGARVVKCTRCDDPKCSGSIWCKLVTKFEGPINIELLPEIDTKEVDDGRKA